MRTRRRNSNTLFTPPRRRRSRRERAPMVPGRALPTAAMSEESAHAPRVATSTWSPSSRRPWFVAKCEPREPCCQACAVVPVGGDLAARRDALRRRGRGRARARSEAGPPAGVAPRVSHCRRRAPRFKYGPRRRVRARVVRLLTSDLLYKVHSRDPAPLAGLFARSRAQRMITTPWTRASTCGCGASLLVSFSMYPACRTWELERVVVQSSPKALKTAPLPCGQTLDGVPGGAAKRPNKARHPKFR